MATFEVREKMLQFIYNSCVPFIKWSTKQIEWQIFKVFFLKIRMYFDRITNR